MVGRRGPDSRSIGCNDGSVAERVATNGVMRPPILKTGRNRNYTVDCTIRDAIRILPKCRCCKAVAMANIGAMRVAKVSRNPTQKQWFRRSPSDRHRGLAAGRYRRALGGLLPLMLPNAPLRVVPLLRRSWSFLFVS